MARPGGGSTAPRRAGVGADPRDRGAPCRPHRSLFRLRRRDRRDDGALSRGAGDAPAGRDATSCATVADVGCGTGILAVAAIALGAARAYAVDIDPAAVRGARRNRDLNATPVDRLSVEQGSLDSLAATLPGSVDIFVCNLYADALVEMVPHLRRISHPRTRGVLSGLRPAEVPVLERVLAAAGWRSASMTEREVVVLSRRRAEPRRHSPYVITLDS